MMCVLQKRSAAALALLLLSTLLNAGCLPVAWVTPPVALEASVGPMLREKPTRDKRELQAAVPIRATILPMQLYSSQSSRAFDVGAGYQFMPVITSRRFIHGPHLEVAWLTPIREPAIFGWLIRQGDQARLGVHLKGYALWESSTHDFGPGATLQFSIEGFHFTATDFEACGANQPKNAQQPRTKSRYRGEDDRPLPYEDTEDEAVFCGVGYAWGESGVGMFVETSYAHIGARDDWYVGVGFKVRLPASIGAGFVAANF